MFSAEPASITTERLLLEPLALTHANEMAPLLDDLTLTTFTGGTPLSLEELRKQYDRQSRGRSPDGSESWFNWIIRERASLRGAGYVQATIDNESRSADVAWVVGSTYQGRGYATEAAAAMVTWLLRNGVVTVTAHVHPDHAASASVARALGLVATSTSADGEIRWVRVVEA